MKSKTKVQLEGSDKLFMLNKRSAVFTLLIASGPLLFLFQNFGEPAFERPTHRSDDIQPCATLSYNAVVTESRRNGHGETKQVEYSKIVTDNLCGESRLRYFVSGIYSSTQGNPPSEQLLNQMTSDWNNTQCSIEGLQQKSERILAASLSNEEAVKADVYKFSKMLFNGLLAREPDSESLKKIQAALNQGVSPDRILKSLVNTQEFIGRLKSICG
jgi:hypothetical protein